VIAYLGRRVIQGVIVMAIVVTIVFVLEQALPGGPARSILGPNATNAQVALFNKTHGLDLPFWHQYINYIGDLIHGNLGFSYHYQESVNTLLVQNLPKSLLLVGLATVIAIVIAIPLGLIQALTRDRSVDHAATGVTFALYAAPVFWLGIVLISLFTFKLKLLPPNAPSGSVGNVIHDPKGLILPVMTLALVSIALFSRYMRSSGIDALSQEWILTAQSKGMTKRRVLYRHVLRNALIPLVTLIGLSIPALVSGALLVEVVFNYPGVGLLFWQAAVNRDFPIMLGFTVVVAAATVIGSLLADLTYALIDPRVRYGPRR
jgi:peptide/nickel transport system permease protein